MTWRQFLANCDEYEKTIIVANLARNYPEYDKYHWTRKQEIVKEILDSEIPTSGGIDTKEGMLI